MEDVIKEPRKVPEFRSIVLDEVSRLGLGDKYETITFNPTDRVWLVSCLAREFGKQRKFITRFLDKGNKLLIIRIL